MTGLNGRTVAVVGATGQLGRALVDTLSASGIWQVTPLSHADIEIADPESVAQVLTPAPAFLINTAYWATEDLSTALRVNAMGARVLAEHCARSGASLVHISTDYVFSGETSAPYKETDCPDPRSVYGISKLTGEQLIRATGARSLIVRVSSLYGPGGSRAKRGTTFVSDMLDMQAAGRTIRVVQDQVHSPTFTYDAAEAIMALMERRATGIAHVSNEGRCTKFAFAERIFTLAGVRADLVPISIADLPVDRHWPRFTALAHERLRELDIAVPRPWEEGLRDHLSRIGALKV